MFKSFCGAMLGLALLAAPCDAALLSGTGGAPNFGTVIDFDAAPTGLFPSITLSGVTFTGVDAPVSIGPDFNGFFNTRGVKSLFNDFDLVPTIIKIDFSSAVDGFAFNWGAADNHWRMTAFDAGAAILESHLIAPVFGSNAGDFYGIAAAGIKSVLLEDTFDRISAGDYVFIDDFTFGTLQAVPEPGTLTAMALGLVSLAGLRRRRRAA